MRPSILDDPERLARVAEVLTAASALEPPVRLIPLPGGANNRVFRLEAVGGPALLKAYFRHPEDRRDRLGTEFAFSAFAWECGVRALPRPLACDPEGGVGLYEYVEGRRAVPGEVSDDWMEQAVDFFRAVNQARQAGAAQALPMASEACLSLEAHLGLVEARVRRLGAASGSAPSERAAASFIRDELVPTWARLDTHVRRGAAHQGLDLARDLAPADQCLSPSDFGYHNVIVEAGGRLRFIDFEYAGWDDPAKTICDFFCQPAVPAPAAWFDRFAAAVLAGWPEAEPLRRRAMLLLPLYRLKWCCIMLNDFLPAGRARRKFAGGEVDGEARAAAQLAKARHALAAIHDVMARGGE
jgi:hypothetical protein